MRIQMESTAMIVDVGGVRTRVWNAVTEDGVQCFAFVASLAFRADETPSNVEEELMELDAPLLDEARLRGKV
jgi:hypothetical protein